MRRLEKLGKDAAANVASSTCEEDLDGLAVVCVHVVDFSSDEDEDY